MDELYLLYNCTVHTLYYGPLALVSVEQAISLGMFSHVFSDYVQGVGLD